MQLRRLLEAKGVKQSWLAQRCGVSPQHISDILAGRRRPNPALAARIAALLGGDAKALFPELAPLEARKEERMETGDRRINVAIIGVGNCASSLVQGVYFYGDASETASVPGLMHVDLGGYHVRDIHFTAAFDIDSNKVGRDLAEAVFTPPNNTFKFCDVPTTGVRVDRGMTHDGLGKYLAPLIPKASGATADIVGILRETNTHVVLNYLPVGAEEATKWYVEQVLAAGCAFINCIPVFIAREEYWRRRFEDRGLPVVGDDVKSQVGATIIHRILTKLFMDRGVRLERTSQLNVGGNTD
ncbi:MAG TPA: helix-turn-helix domain-containing protein, partial [Dehalococcoidia bacterium]|nr:helix-turn-helix domain-containing protein [Dehalococcoidia bacterium]